MPSVPAVRPSSAGGGPALLVVMAAAVPALVLVAFVGVWVLVAVLLLGLVVGCSAVVRSVASRRPRRRPRSS